MSKLRYLFLHAITIIFFIAMSVSFGLRILGNRGLGSNLIFASMIPLGLITGWIIAIVLNKKVTFEPSTVNLLLILSLVIGAIVWCFRPVAVPVPGDSVTLQILNDKNPLSQGYQANLVGWGWDGAKPSLTYFTNVVGWVKGENSVTGDSTAQMLTIPGGIRDTGRLDIQFEATERGGFVRVKTNYKESIIDLYASPSKEITVSVDKDYINPIYFTGVYLSDFISISTFVFLLLLVSLAVYSKIEGESSIADKVMIAAAYLYLAVPIILFAIGWLKPVFAILFIAVIAVGLWKVEGDFEFKTADNKSSLNFILISLAVALVWVFSSGIGGYTFQNLDFNARNAIFHDLINHNWPVVYDYQKVPEIKAIIGNSGTLIYYFTFWLPAAFVGKYFGWLAANAALFIWTVTGITLCFYLVSRFTGIRKSWVLLIFVFWSGLDILGGAIVENRIPYLTLLKLLQNQHLEWWTSPKYLLQYSSHTAQLFYVFNQALPAWLVTLLVLNSKKLKSILFTSSLVLLFAPLPSLGLLPFVVYKILEEIPKQAFVRWGISRLKELATVQNLVSGGILFVTAVLFFLSNNAAQKHGFLWDVRPEDMSLDRLIFIYIVFCLVEFILYIVIVYKTANKLLLFILFITLAVIPLYSYGEYNDFAMRVSIPALLILCLLFIQRINYNIQSVPSIEKNIYSAIFIIVILISCITPMHELFRARDYIVLETPSFMDDWKTFDLSRGMDKSEYIQNYVTGNASKHIFFQTIGK